MSYDRITPYDDQCTVEDRIDEIVATGANVHIEMLDDNAAWMSVGGDIFTIHVKNGRLIIAWRENVCEGDRACEETEKDETDPSAA